MRKRINRLFIFCLIIISENYVFAQQVDTTKFHKWEIGIQVNTAEKLSEYESSLFQYPTMQGLWKYKSFSYGLKFSYNPSKNCFVRFKAGTTHFEITQHKDTRDDSYGGPSAPCLVADRKIKETGYYFVPGIACRLKKKSFALYGGFELPLTIHKNYIDNTTETNYDTTYTNVIYNYNYKTNAPGGFTIGVGAFSGFDFYCSGHFSVGADLSSTLLYSKLGGNILTTANETVTHTTTTSHYLYKFQGFNYSGEKLSINLTYSF